MKNSAIQTFSIIIINSVFLARPHQIDSYSVVLVITINMIIIIIIIIIIVLTGAFISIFPNRLKAPQG